MVEKILIVEDEAILQETLAYNFRKEGYDIQVAGDGLVGLRMAREWLPDLLILDVMLPQMDGFEVCRRLKNERDFPILLLTARTDEIDRVVGLEIGADDYITKPFSLRELMVRVKNHLRVYQQIRSGRTDNLKEDLSTGDELVFDNLVMDRKRHEFRLNGQPVELKPREYELLSYLVENHGRAVSRDILLEQVWGWNYKGESRTVDVHVRWLRNKIEFDPAKPVRIITVPGIGYRFEG